jgi:hypothetical protein
MFWQSEFPKWISSWQLNLCNCVSPLWYSWPSSTSAKLLTVKAALEIMLLKSMTKCSFLQVTYFQDGSYTPVSPCILRSLTKVDWSRYGLTVKEVQSADCIGGVLQFQEQASFSSMHIILHTYHLYIQQLVNSVVHCMLFAWESVHPYWEFQIGDVEIRMHPWIVSTLVTLVKLLMFMGHVELASFVHSSLAFTECQRQETGN